MMTEDNSVIEKDMQFENLLKNVSSTLNGDKF